MTCIAYWQNCPTSKFEEGIEVMTNTVKTWWRVRKKKWQMKRPKMPDDVTKQTVAYLDSQSLSRSQQQKPCCCKVPAHINKHKTHGRLLQFQKKTICGHIQVLISRKVSSYMSYNTERLKEETGMCQIQNLFH